MAMLLLPDVFARTWGDRSRPPTARAVDEPFWPDAIAARPAAHPGLRLHGRGVLGPRVDAAAAGLRLHLRQAPLRPPARAATRGRCASTSAPTPTSSDRSARFLENHDEPRAAAVFPRRVHQAAAVVTFLVPGLRFFHEGQLEGRRIRVSMHLGRRPAEPVDASCEAFYDRLLDVLKRPEVRDGDWRLLDCRPAWDGNPTWDRFLAFAWEGADGARLLVAVNYAPDAGAVLRAARRGPTWAAASGSSPTCEPVRGTSATATISRGAASTWTCRPGATTSSRWPRAA